MKRPSAAQNRAALAELKALSGGPGAVPGAASTRLHGRYATATVGGVTLHLYEWELNWEAEYFDATAHGERWKVWVPGDQQWTVRARGYFVRSTQAYLNAAAKTASDPTAVTVTCYQGVTATGAEALWVGSGFFTRVNFSAPMAMVTQELEIRGTGIPSDIQIG